MKGGEPARIEESEVPISVEALGRRTQHALHAMQVLTQTRYSVCWPLAWRESEPRLTNTRRRNCRGT